MPGTAGSPQKARSAEWSLWLLKGPHLAPGAVGTLFPNNDPVVERRARQQVAEFGVRPGDLPHRPLVPKQVRQVAHLERKKKLARLLRNLIRRRGRLGLHEQVR